MSDEQITDADPDTEEKLREMKALKDLIKRSEEKYDELKAEVIADFEGPRYFMSHEGQKLYAFKVAPTRLQHDLELLLELVGEEQFEAVTKVVIDEDAYKNAVATQRIPVTVYKQVTRALPYGKPHLRYGDPEKPARED